MTQAAILIDAAGILPPHEITDEAKLHELTAAMASNGWQGAPVVWMPSMSQALTGSHRILAALAANVEVPVVDIADLAAESGIDWDDLVDQTGGDPMFAATHLAGALPAAAVSFYGLDLH